MWDPRHYLDTDFGLDDDERFEPADDDENLDLTRSAHVMTALGPIDPADLGVTFLGEHLLFETDGIASGERLDDPIAAIDELTAFVTSGARSLLDVATRDSGRDVVGLIDIARRVPAHIIVSTGGDASTIELEVREGIGPRKVKPGVAIVETESALQVAQGLGMPTIVHRLPGGSVASDRTALVLGQEDSFADANAWPGFVIATLAGEPDRLADLADLVRRMIDAGSRHRLLLAMGWNRRSLWHAHEGQPGLAFGMERIPLALMDVGVEAADVRALLIDNPARFLTRQPSLHG